MTNYRIFEYTTNHVDVCDITMGSLTRTEARHKRIKQTRYGVEAYTERVEVELDVFFTCAESASIFIEKRLEADSRDFAVYNK